MKNFMKANHRDRSKPQWSRTPKYIMRVYSIKRILATWPKGRFLEYGSGRGEITKWLLEKQFYGAACEVSDSARKTLHNELSEFQGKILITGDTLQLPTENYDYVFAFEVLEHIEDDVVTLKAWVRHLKPNGKVLFTIPAHQRKFSSDDEYVGHYRRYDRNDVRLLFKHAGLEVDYIYNLGFPLGNFTRILSRIFFNYNPRYETAKNRTEFSGLERPASYAKFKSIFNDQTMLLINMLQCRFWHLDLGDNLLVVGTKREK